MKNTLKFNSETEVKFSEADPLGIVWHGHYIRYFEDGREAFGKHYGIGYLDFYKMGYVIPVVNVQCDYKKSLRYGDKVIIETEFLPSEAAKMYFKYRLYKSGTEDIVASGSSVQVFLDKNTSLLQLATPEFFEHWKKQNGLI